jgi:flagellar biosynthesis protein FliP
VVRRWWPALTIGMGLVAAGAAAAQSPGWDGLVRQLGKPESGDLVGVLRLVVALAVLSVAPSLLMMVTAFTRIIIVLSFLRGAMGTQTIPPNSVLAGLSLFLTFFVMYPTWDQIQQEAVKPYTAGQIGYQQALEKGGKPLHEFMLRQTRDRDLLLFMQLGGLTERPPKERLPFRILVPAFMISELRTAFEIGLVLYLPFLVIDLVVASSLMSLGMMMLPPVMISLPMKILLFVMADGWSLLVRSVVVSFG